MFLNHARPPWAGLDWERGVSATGSRCTAARSWSPRASEHVALELVRLRLSLQTPPGPRPLASAPPLSPSLNLPDLRRGFTFAVKFNGGALCRAGAPGTEVDGTALQHSRLAGVSLGRSHQHADPAEGKGEAAQGGLLALLQSPQAGRTQASGPRSGWAWHRCPPGCIYISEDATDARGTGRSQAVPMCRCH